MSVCIFSRKVPIKVPFKHFSISQLQLCLLRVSLVFLFCVRRVLCSSSPDGSLFMSNAASIFNAIFFFGHVQEAPNTRDDIVCTWSLSCALSLHLNIISEIIGSRTEQLHILLSCNNDRRQIPQMEKFFFFQLYFLVDDDCVISSAEEVNAAINKLFSAAQIVAQVTPEHVRALVRVASLKQSQRTVGHSVRIADGERRCMTCVISCNQLKHSIRRSRTLANDFDDVNVENGFNDTETKDAKVERKLVT